MLLTGFGLVNLLLSWRLLPETGTRGGGLSGRALWRAWRGLLASPSLVLFLALQRRIVSGLQGAVKG